MAARDLYALKRAEAKTTGWCFPTRPLEDHRMCGRKIGDALCACSKQGCPCNPVSVASDPSPDVTDPPAEAVLAPVIRRDDPARSVVTEPCLLPDLDETVYHADPVPAALGGSLSQSGAKMLLPPSTPMHFRWSMDHPPEMKKQFDVGHAVHAKVLGVGAPVEVVRAKNKKGELYDAKDYATVSAQQHRDEIRERGLIPLLRSELDVCDEMAESVLAHPLASVLFQKGYGTPEVSSFWRDDETNLMLRARYDWLPDADGQGRVILPDLKTSVDANPDHFGKTAANYGYYVQAPWYLAGLEAHDIGDGSNAFVFVSVEKKPPYPVSVAQLDEDAMALGRSQMRRAIDTYARCMESGEWPGYTTEVVRASLPVWFTKAHEGAPF